MLDFPRFRSAHGLRPRDWLPSLSWSHVGNEAELEELAPDAEAVLLRSVSASLIGALPPTVRALRLGWCPDVRDDTLALLSGLPALEWLFLDHPLHPELGEGALEPAAALPKLWGLALRARPEESRAPWLHSAHLAPLRGRPLRALALSSHPGLEDLSPLGDLPSLRSLDLTGCPARRGLSASAVETLFIDAPLPMAEDTWSAIGRMERLVRLSACQRTGPLPPLALPALEVAYLFGARGLSVSGPALARLDLGGGPLPAPAQLSAHGALEAVRLPAHKLGSAHLSAISGVRSVWLSGGAPRIKPADWRLLSGCRSLVLDCALRLGRRHLAALGALRLETLVILRGAERLKPAELAGLAGLSGAERIHLEGCRDVSGLQAALPGARVTTEAAALVSEARRG